MAWHLTTDVDELWREAGPWFAEQPVENAPLLAEIGHLLATSPTADGPACGWWTDDRDTVGGAFVQAPRHSPLLTRMSRSAVAGLATLLAGTDALGVPGVIVDDVVAEWAAHGTRLTPRRSFTVHRLDGTPAPPACAGRPRIAGPDDRALLHRWFDQLMAGLPGDPSERAYVVDDPLSTGALVLWEVDGEPVAMCSRSRVLADTVRMGACYAPDDEAHADAAFGAAVVEARRHARDVTVLAATGDEHEEARLVACGFVPAATRVALTAPDDC